MLPLLPLQLEIIIHQNPTGNHLRLMRGKVSPRTSLITYAIHQMVGGRLHGLIHLLLAWLGAQAVEAEAVELVGVSKSGVIEDGVLDVGADIGAGGEKGAVREG